MNAAAQPFDARALRQVLGAFVTGVTVITTLDRNGKAHGLTANSFSSVSLDPPLILWSQSRSAPSHPVFREAERFVVNILADDQIEVANRFAHAGSDKFAGCVTRAGLGGVPLIQGCAAWLECRRIDSFPGGDHLVFLGQVERIERTAMQPLVFGGGKYLVAQPHDLGLMATPGGTNVARLKAVRLATRALVELSDDLDETLGLGVWGNKGPTIVRWEEASEPVSDNLRTGLVLPVLTSATGLAFAAWLPRQITQPFIEEELAQGLDLVRVEQELAQARASGIVRLVGSDRFTDLYGTSISAASVPVFDDSGQMVLALTAIGSSQRIDLSDGSPLVTGLRHCAAALSFRLGGRSPAQVASNDPVQAV
ncbi:MAG TPA: flavin reductase [Ramlibacter sp.]|uniref:flavin reductase n=1 Tax=Ramlibacter sp. TaxID=1917967 RepID=UPI002D7E2EF1|nr:flavin reductase [Ramlibacter sp.]HET8746385.1 flavin reductase [Ramlibacter sp.]